MKKIEKINTKEFRHQLIQEEFRKALTSIEYKIPTETEGVVILSAKGFIVKEREPIDYSLPENAENKFRIETGIEIIKQIVANKTNKNIDDIKNEDILQYGPPLLLNGMTEQLPIMKQIVLQLGFPVEKIELVDCGRSGVANTKTQFEVMNRRFVEKKPKHITFVTSDYHVPRTARTGDKNLDPNVSFDVIPVPHKKYPYNVFRIVRGEVKRIISYAAKGDISKDISLKTKRPEDKT